MANTVAQFSASMMENHIPAAVLDAANGFAAAVGQDGSQFVFSIGSDGIFRISADANSGCSGWTTQDPATALLTQIGSGAIAYFAVGYSSTTDTITIAIVISGITGTGDQLYVAANLPASGAASWMIDNTITWTGVPFDCTFYSAITAANLNVSAISLMLTDEYGDAETPTAYVTAIDPTDANFRVFSVTLPPPAVQPPNTAWNNVVLPTDSNESLAIAAGQPIPALGQGIYVLGTSGGGPVLDFVPAGGEGTVSYTPVPAGATAIDSLVLPDLSQQQDSTVTELYVAGGGSITICQSGENGPILEVISGSSYIVNTTQLHVMTNYDPVNNPDGLVIVWGVNNPANGSPQVFYSHVLYTARYSAASWSPVVVLMSEAQAVAPILNSAAGTIGFLTITSSATYTTSNYAASPQPVLLGMNSDPVSLLWHQSYLPVPSTGDYIRLQSYSSQLKVVDPTTGIPQSNTPLSITTATDVTFIVNGQAVNCAANQATAVQTDAAGVLTVINTVSGISGVPFSIADGSGDPVSLMLNGSAVTQPYDPTGTVTPTLTAGMTGDLTTMQCQASNAPAPGTYPLVDASSPNLSTASTAFTAINQNMPTATAASLATRRGNAIEARARLARRRAEAAAAGLAIGDENGVEILIGDLAQWVINAVDDVADVIVNEVAEGFQLVVTFAEGVFNAVVTTVEEAWAAVVAVFQWIGAAFDDIFRWLAFIFNWTEMKVVHAALSSAFSAGFGAFTGELSSVQSTIDNWFASTLSSIEGNAFSGTSGSIQSNVTSNAPSPVVNGTNMSSDPRVGWVGSQLKNAQNVTVASPGAKRARGATRTVADSTYFFSGISGCGNGLVTSQNEQSGSVAQLGSSANGGSGSIGNAVQGFVTDIGVDMLQGMQSAIDTGFQYVEAAATDADTALTQTITIPVLSGIYQDIVGSPPSMQDIICLCAGVVVTVSYNLVSEGNLPDLQTYVQGGTFQGYFSGFNVGAGQSFRRRRLGDSLDPAAAGVVGGLSILQGFAIAVDYMGEQSDVVDLVAIATIVETFCDFLSCCIAAGSGGVDDDYADFKTLGAGLRLVLLIAMLQAGFRNYFGCPESQEIAWVGEGVATGLGLWALVDILEDVNDASGLDWLDMLIDLTALPSALLTEGDVQPYAPIVAVLRAFAAEGLGIAFINQAVTA